MRRASEAGRPAVPFPSPAKFKTIKKFDSYNENYAFDFMDLRGYIIDVNEKRLNLSKRSKI